MSVQQTCKNVRRKRRSRTLGAGILKARMSLVSATILIICCAPVLALPPSSLQSLFIPNGPIHDLKCNVEDLEQANDSQLYTILHELTQTAFFKHFVVDLDERCPITTWTQKSPTKKSQSTDMEPSIDTRQDETCTGLPDMDPNAEPACSVTGEASQTSFPFEKQSDEVPDLVASSFGEKSKSDSHTAVGSESEFECGGGDQELDDDAEPLCTLAEDEFSTGAATPIRDLISSAYKSLSFGKWESESQKKTFSWSQKTDPVVTDASELAEADCDEGTLPDTFWVDMCSSITAGETTKVVNLALNPERNTGYNGTHIWNAIYEENCILDGAPADLCYEERVLYRLLSGLHTSTTLSIAKNYYAPSKRKGRVNWEANPQYFMDRFEHNPEHIRNLHFSYVVLLRALQKASPFLYKYEIRTGDIVEDETAAILLKRLLDSSILQSCQSVFSAFDESLMFKEQVSATSDVVSLQQNFKGVFHNISSILDCVQCQQCKLHGKMAMLGYGTALKILFMNENRLATSLERNEIVAFINTVAKFSESLREVRELTQLYWDSHTSRDDDGPTTAATAPPMATDSSVDPIFTAVGLVAVLAREGRIDATRESELVKLALSGSPEILALAKHYGGDVDKFLEFSQVIESSLVSIEPDAVIVGSGLAGLAAAVNILDRGGRVVIMEKEHRLGGNSNKASSGINACCPNDDIYDDVLESFRNDTIKSAGNAARPDLIDVLVGNSAQAVTWLKERIGVDLSLLAQLGGHSHKRTHRPSNGMVGAEIIYGMQKAVRAYEKTGKAKIMVDARVTQLLRDEVGRVVGVEFDAGNGKELQKATNVVLATGGFAADRSHGSLLEKYRPELLNMPATAGSFSTGDGVILAQSLGAGVVDMDQVQVHPTGWVDPADPLNPTKVLAAELMRGVGGILLNRDGERFCNELGTRAYVTHQMLSHDEHFAETHQWNPGSEIPTFSLVLALPAALDGKKHVDLYTHKGLVTKLNGVAELAEWMDLDVDTVRSTLRQYQQDAQKGVDAWGKSSFRGLPSTNLDEEVFYAGKVVPVLHYCMGGITIDTEGNVLDESGAIIPGLHAAGEVAGGVHGNNRLGGNSLLECTVFGTIVGKKIPIHSHPSIASQKIPQDAKVESKPKADRTVSPEELARHSSPEDCWIAIGDTVYDMTAFAQEHPAGPKSIHQLGGMDGTEAFLAVHNMQMMEDFEDERIGILAT